MASHGEEQAEYERGDDAVLGLLWRHAFEALELAPRDGARRLRQLRVGERRLERRHLVLLLLPFGVKPPAAPRAAAAAPFKLPQLTLDRAHLLPQVVLLARVVQLALHARVDLPRHLQHVQLLAHQRDGQRETRLVAYRLQHTLLLQQRHLLGHAMTTSRGK